MKFCCGLNFLTPTFAARGRSDFLAEIVGRAAGTVLPGFFGPIHVHGAVTAVFSRSRAVELFPLWTENKSIKYQNKKNSKKFDHQTEIYPFIEKNHQVL